MLSRILYVSVIIEFAAQTIIAGPFYFLKYLLGNASLEQAASVSSLLVVIFSFVINPVIFMVIMYKEGRGVDLEKHYVRIGIYLSVGGLVGGSIGFWVSPLVLGGQFSGGGLQTNLESLILGLSLLVTEIEFGLATLLAGFTAITIGFLRKRNAQTHSVARIGIDKSVAQD